MGVRAPWTKVVYGNTNEGHATLNTAPADICGAVYDHDPVVLHFGCHGGPDEQLNMLECGPVSHDDVFEGIKSALDLIRSDATVAGRIPRLKCVVLNMCYSKDTLGRRLGELLKGNAVVICWSEIASDNVCSYFASEFFTWLKRLTNGSGGVKLEVFQQCFETASSHCQKMPQKLRMVAGGESPRTLVGCRVVSEEKGGDHGEDEAAVPGAHLPSRYCCLSSKRHRRLPRNPGRQYRNLLDFGSG